MGASPIVVAFQILLFSTSMIVGERVPFKILGCLLFGLLGGFEKKNVSDSVWSC